MDTQRHWSVHIAVSFHGAVLFALHLHVSRDSVLKRNQMRDHGTSPHEGQGRLTNSSPLGRSVKAYALNPIQRCPVGLPAAQVAVQQAVHC